MFSKSEKGQATVEFGLILPVLLLVLCGIIDFGWIFGNQISANNAAREAARYTAIHYNDSETDDDEATAASIVADRAPTLSSAVVTLTATDETVTVTVTCDVDILTPIIGALFPGGVYRISAESTMRIE